MLFRVPLFCLLLTFSLCGYSAENREIVLKDGSVLTGEILSFDGSKYKIKSHSLGTVVIDGEEIRTIRSTSKSNSPDQQTTISQQGISTLQQQMLSNQDIMALINSLQNDPQVQAILADPQLMQAISSGDIQTLMNNPKFKEFMNNPAIKQITNQTLQNQ
jgi:hypothetical protein